jgi:hypothetical protein
MLFSRPIFTSQKQKDSGGESSTPCLLGGAERFVKMMTRSAKWRAGFGLSFVLLGLLFALNGLLSGPRAFGFGGVAVVALCFAGLLLVALERR